MCGAVLLAAAYLSSLILMATHFYRVWVHPDEYVASLEKNAAKYGYDRVFGKLYYRKWIQRVMISFAFIGSLLLIAVLLWLTISIVSS
jgi:hypothetical protein